MKEEKIKLKKVGILKEIKYREDAVVYDSECLARTTKCNGGGNYMNNLRIRKLTPKECLRLMGFTDEDYLALKDIGLSDSAIYHVAGDSIITTCLASIIYPFTNNDRKGHKTIVDDYVANNIIQIGEKEK